MGKTLLLTAILFAAIVPTTAQTEAENATPVGAPRNEGSLYRGAYEVTEDGTLIYGGDVALRCEDFLRLGAPLKTRRPST